MYGIRCMARIIFYNLLIIDYIIYVTDFNTYFFFLLSRGADMP